MERKESSQGWRQLKTGEGGQMNRDIVRRLVKRKQSRDGRLKDNSVFMFTLETDSTERQNNLTLRGKVTERREVGLFYLSKLFKGAS